MTDPFFILETSSRLINFGATAHTVEMTDAGVIFRADTGERLSLSLPGEFSIREGSGGKGEFPGGDGTRRVLRFLEDMECAILSSHRKRPPAGLAKGGDGEVGKTEIRRLNGELEELEYCDQTSVVAGEAVIVTTPSGGGYTPEG